MTRYSFNADLRLVLQRLAAANAAGPAEEPAASAKPVSCQTAARQPRVEIANVALRKEAHDSHDAVT
jgi:hypothetical protein